MRRRIVHIDFIDLMTTPNIQAYKIKNFNVVTQEDREAKT